MLCNPSCLQHVSCDAYVRPCPLPCSRLSAGWREERNRRGVGGVRGLGLGSGEMGGAAEGSLSQALLKVGGWWQGAHVY